MYSGESLRLVYHYKQTPIRTTRQKFYEVFPETWGRDVLTTCNHCTAATIITWSSIDDIHSKLGKQYNHLRYRCNIVVNGKSGTPYEEDQWRKVR